MQCDVQVFDSAEKRAVPRLSQEVNVANVVVSGETRPFRFLARHLEFRVVPEESYAIDLGCSTGETTYILAKRFKKVIGLDVSTEIVGKGLLDHPDLDLRVLDVLSDRNNVVDLIKNEMSDAPVVFFVDIGGDRLQDTVILFISFLMEKFETPTIVVKSRKLYRYLVKTCIDEDKVHCLPDSWEKLVDDTKQKELKDRKCFHPQRYNLMLAPDTGIPICRYYNYSTCKKGDECGQDHTHCHHCLKAGHRGYECEELANELIVRKKKT